jgi:hypothetical protein
MQKAKTGFIFLAMLSIHILIASNLRNLSPQQFTLSSAGLLALTWFVHRSCSEYIAASKLESMLIIPIAVWGLLPVIWGGTYAYYQGGLDIAWYAQAIWNIASDQPPVVTIALPLHHLSNHFEIIIFPLGWIYSVFQDAMPPYIFLYAVQLGANLMLLFLAGYILYKRQQDVQAMSFGVATVLVVSHAGFIGANRFEFHPPTFGLTLIILSLGLAVLHRPISASLIALLSGTCGEMFTIVGPTCSALFFSQSLHRPRIHRALGLLGFILGFTLLLLYYKKIKFLFATTGHHTDFVTERYGIFGSSVVDLIMAPFLRPDLFFREVFESRKMFFVAKLLIPIVCAFSLLLLFCKGSRLRKSIAEVLRSSWVQFGFLIMLAPLAKILMSDYAPYLRHDVHYSADILPGILLITFGVLVVALPLQRSLPRWIDPLILVVCSMEASMGSVNLFEKPFTEKFVTNELRNYIRQLGPQVSVYSDNDTLSAELAGRDSYYGPFSDQNLDPIQFPEILFLSWPPQHFNSGVIRPESFRSSFKLTDDALEVYYRNHKTLYSQIEVFQIPNWGAVSVWRSRGSYEVSR